MKTTEPQLRGRKFHGKAGKGKTITTFAEDAVVFTQGDAADALYNLRRGKVKVTVVSNAGKEAVITVLGAGDFLGEGCLAGQQLRMSTATAMTECSIMRLERGTVMEMLQTEPVFTDLLLSYMLTHAIRTEENLIDQLFNSSEKRLARAPAAGQFRERGQARNGNPQDQPGSVGGNGRHYAFAGQLFHEQIPPAWVHQIQRHSRGPQLAS